MSDDKEDVLESQTGPPARNLRKYSAKQNISDFNMAGMGDKVNNEQKCTNLSARKALKKTKNNKVASTPSVKDWLTSEEGDEEGAAREVVEVEYGKQWTMSRQGQASGIESTCSEDDNYRAAMPVESWGDNDDASAEDSEAEVFLNRGKQSSVRRNPNYRANGNEDEQVVGNVTDEHDIFNEQEFDIDNLSEDQMKTLLKALCLTVRTLTEKLNSRQENFSTLNRKIIAIDNRAKLTRKAVIRHDKEISNNSRSINQQQLQSMRSNLLISGIKEDKDEKCKDVVQTFFKEKMKIKKDVHVATAHRIGKQRDNEYRTMKIVLSDARDKGAIYKHSKNLKDLTNENGDAFYINDQLPDVQAEHQRRCRDKIRINKTLIDAQQQSMEWKRGDFIVEGAKFQQKVVEPTCAEILEMDDNQLQKVLSVKLHQGDQRTKNGSTFLGFAMKAHTTEQVVLGYKQLKYRFLDATHLICGHRIVDPDVAHMTDSVDGGELGAGRRLVKYLMEHSCENIAVFVVRFHRGPNLGPQRFDLINEAAKSAVDKMPPDMNRLLGIPPPAPTSYSNPARPQYNEAVIRGRGGFGGSVRGHGSRGNHVRTRGTTAAARQLFHEGSQQERAKYPIQSVEV